MSTTMTDMYFRIFHCANSKHMSNTALLKLRNPEQQRFPAPQTADDYDVRKSCFATLRNFVCILMFNVLCTCRLNRERLSVLQPYKRFWASKFSWISPLPTGDAINH